MSEELKALQEKIDNLEKENEYLRERLKQEQETMKNMVELPIAPIECATMLINSYFEYETSMVQKAFGAGDKAFAERYSPSELKQIAQHLLVYCEHAEDDES